MPWAERSRYRALICTAGRSPPRQAGPIVGGLLRHQVGVRIWNAIFSGG